MENKRRGSWTHWLLLLGVFALKEIQAERNTTSQAQEPNHVEKQRGELKSVQGHHRHQILFTIVSSRNYFYNYTIIHVIDDVLVCSYYRKNKLVFNEEWIRNALGEDYIEQKMETMIKYETYSQLALRYLIFNDTNPDKNHTLQYLVACELNNDIQLGHYVWIALDGEDVMKINDQIKKWIVLKPGAELFKSFTESSFQEKVKEDDMKKYCVDMMRIILQHSSMKENVAPEVSVSRHDASDGRVTFSCTATGFYPRSILLRWEKDGELGVWGQESSSGTLPNIDSTFYLRITLELPPGDSGTGYTCVVEHIKLQTPAVYPVPEKPSVKRPWIMVLGLLTVIVLLSCAGAFVLWKKKKTGQATGFMN